MSSAPAQKRRPGNPKGRPPRTEITSSQKKCIELMLMGRNLSHIAQILQIEQSTITNWRKQEPFRKAVADALETIDTGCAIDVRQLVRRAYEELDGLLQDPNPMVRLGACRLTLEAHSKVVQQLEEKEAMKMLEARLEAVQAVASQQLTSPQLSAAQEPVVEAEVVEVALDSALDGDAGAL